MNCRSLIICLCHCIVLMGCSVYPQVEQAHHREVEDLVSAQMHPYSVKDAELSTKTISKPFHEVLKHILDTNLALEIAQLKKQKREIGFDQATSIYWPRVTVETSLELPINEDDFDFSEGLNYGVFLRYNFLDAIYARDAMSVERLKVQLSEEAIKRIQKDLSLQLIELMSEQDWARNRRNLLEQQLENSRRAIELFSLTNEINASSEANLQKWKDLENSYTLHLDEVRAQELKLQFRLQSLLRQYPSGSTAITDASEVLSRFENLPVPATIGPDLLQFTVDNNHEIRKAQIDLLLSKMAIEAAKQERFPKIWLSLGLGKIDLDQVDSSSASVVPSVGLSYDLFDFGDKRRTILRAQTNYHVARRKFKRATQEVFEQLYLSVLDLNTHTSRQKFQEIQFNNSRKMVDELRTLSQSGYIQGEHYITAQQQALDDDFTYIRAKHAYRKLLIQYLKINGDLPKWLKAELQPNNDPLQNVEGAS